MPNLSELTAQFAAAGLTCGPWVHAPIDDLDLYEATLAERTIEGNQILVQAEPMGLSYLAQALGGQVVYWGTLYQPEQVPQLIEAIKANLA